MATFTLDRIEIADRPLARMRGLLGRERMDADEGMLLRPAGSIHTFFMRFPIDAVFLDDDLVVLGTFEHLEPWGTAGRHGAKAVLELSAGTCERLQVKRGDKLVLPA
jgi:uncharacterized protein